MNTRENPYIENLKKELNSIPILMPEDLARTLPLYIKTLNDNSIVPTVSIAYIRSYSGKTPYAKYKRYFNQMHEMFLRNGIGDVDRRLIFIQVAERCSRFPTTIKEMEILTRIVIEETQKMKRFRKTHELRKNLLDKFKLAIKKYLYLTYTLGFNEPSSCAKSLAEQHKIDKYILSGDFPLLLLPFLPEVEDTIKRCYENYHMKDSWEMLQGRYFNHKQEFSVLAIEIKSVFTKNIGNFSEYFDKMYTDTYYRLMIGKKR